MPHVVTQRTATSFKKGETIFRDGDIGDEMFILKSGRVEVVKKLHDEEIVLARLEAGSFFGEMALFGDKHRTATIRALENCETAVINKHVLDAQLSRVPDWFVAIMRTLVQRLKETNKRQKSRYTISLEYSLLKMIYWVANKNGERSEGGINADLGTLLLEVQTIMGVSKEELTEKLRDFNFVHMIKFSEDKNEIFIPDTEKLENFLLFLQAKGDKKTRMTTAFAELKKDPVSLQYFERIYQLLARKKGVHDNS